MPPSSYSEAFAYDLERRVSRMLRHRAAKYGFKMRPDGFVELEAVLRACRLPPEVTPYDFLEILYNSSKRGECRFEYYVHPGTSTRWLRATSQHSVGCVDCRLVAKPAEECFRDIPPGLAQSYQQQPPQQHPMPRTIGLGGGAPYGYRHFPETAAPPSHQQFAASPPHEEFTQSASTAGHAAWGPSQAVQANRPAPPPGPGPPPPPGPPPAYFQQMHASAQHSVPAASQRPPPYACAGSAQAPLPNLQAAHGAPAHMRPSAAQEDWRHVSPESIPTPPPRSWNVQASDNCPQQQPTQSSAGSSSFEGQPNQHAPAETSQPAGTGFHTGGVSSSSAQHLPSAKIPAVTGPTRSQPKVRVTLNQPKMRIIDTLGPLIEEFSDEEQVTCGTAYVAQPRPTEVANPSAVGEQVPQAQTAEALEEGAPGIGPDAPEGQEAQSFMSETPQLPIQHVSPQQQPLMQQQPPQSQHTGDGLGESPNHGFVQRHSQSLNSGIASSAVGSATRPNPTKDAAVLDSQAVEEGLAPASEEAGGQEAQEPRAAPDETAQVVRDFGPGDARYSVQELCLEVRRRMLLSVLSTNTDWPGWYWAQRSDGIEGYVPTDCVQMVTIDDF